MYPSRKYKTCVPMNPIHTPGQPIKRSSMYQSRTLCKYKSVYPLTLYTPLVVYYQDVPITYISKYKLFHQEPYTHPWLVYYLFVPIIYKTVKSINPLHPLGQPIHWDLRIPQVQNCVSMNSYITGPVHHRIFMICCTWPCSRLDTWVVHDIVVCDGIQSYLLYPYFLDD